MAALFDSDRMLPGKPTHSHQLAGGLRANGIEVHVLELRESENYVPNRVLRGSGRYAKTSQKIACLKQLTDGQRGHFDMKKGFSGKGAAGAQVPASQATLFATASCEVVHGLSEGFGLELTKLLEREAMRGNVTVADFKALGSGVPDELRDLLAMVLRII